MEGVLEEGPRRVIHSASSTYFPYSPPSPLAPHYDYIVVPVIGKDVLVVVVDG